MSLQSMHTAASGMNANASALAVIAENVANSNSDGYKEKGMKFSTLVTGSPLTSGKFSPGGVQTKIFQNVDSQGLLRPTANVTDLAISGNGFFLTSGNLTDKEIFFSRAGSFTTNDQGYLVSEGRYLQGWTTDEHGNIPATTNTSVVNSLENINISKVLGFAKGTKNISLAVNLPSSLTDAPLNSTYQTNIQMYDSLGAEHALTITWTKAAIGQWNAEITCPDATAIKKGDVSGNTYGGTTPLVVLFNSDGSPKDFDGASTPPNIFIDWNDTITNATDSTITLDLGVTGKMSGVTSRAGDYSQPVISQDGRKFGTFSGVTIDEEGVVSAIFSNSEMLKIARIAMANFAAPNELEPQSGNSWVQTDKSGNYVLSMAKKGGFGKIISSSLESSTTDVATQLTKMIEYQHGFAANTRTVKTADQMFSELLGIK